jgi:UDP-3-O-[3-hydroxymyristoyl] glucosamine N-acyltransferase
MHKTLQEVAELVGGRVVGDGSVAITGVSGIKEAKPGQLTFLVNPKYERYLATTSASAVIVSEEYESHHVADGKPLLVAGNAYGTFARAVELFAESESVVGKGVHPTAVVAETATLGKDVAIGANTVVMDRVTIVDRSVVHPGVYLGSGVSVGGNSVIHPNVTIKASSVLGDGVIVHAGTVIGSDGFGFAREGEAHRKIPQIGNVVVEDNVEIGANVCIDRATIGTTRICKGTKIDNLVQIGHNVVIGEDSIVVAQVGISGSTEIGKHVTLAGQAGIVGHIHIGDNAMVGAQAGVTRSIPAGERVSGYPAQKHTVSKRLNACLQCLPSLFQKVKELEKRIARIEEE